MSTTSALLALAEEMVSKATDAGSGTHLLLDHGHAHTFAPDADLLHGGGTEGVGGAKIDLLAGFLKLVCELSNGCGLAHAVHADDKDDVRGVVGGQLPIVVVGGVVL